MRAPRHKARGKHSEGWYVLAHLTLECRASSAEENHIPEGTQEVSSGYAVACSEFFIFIEWYTTMEPTVTHLYDAGLILSVEKPWKD